MKRILPLALCAAMVLSLLSSCAKPGLNGPTPDKPGAASTEVSDPAQTESTAADGPLDGPEPEEPSLSLPPETETPSAQPSEEPSAPVEPTPTPTPKPAPTPKPTPTPNPEPSLSLPPEPEATPDPGPEESGESSAPAGQPDLRQFYEDIMFDDPDFAATAELYNEYLDVLYPGLTAISTQQLVVFQPMMSAVVCEIALVEVTDRADVPAVLDILQARVKYMVGDEENPGAAWYPASIEGWQNNSRIVSNGSYIMLIAYEKCDDIVARFDVLFE